MVVGKIAAYGQGLLLRWNFIRSSQELKPSRIAADEDKN